MPGSGKPRQYAVRVKKTKRAAEEATTASKPTKRNRQEDQVVETISQGEPGASDTESGTDIIENEKPEGIIHFDNVFKTVQIDFQNYVSEIEPLRCGGADLAVHIPMQLQEKILNQQYINFALLLKGSLELS